MTPATPPPSNLRRAFEGQILLYLGIVCGVCLDIPSMMSAPSPSASGQIETPRGPIPIPSNFHYLGFLNVVFRDVTMGFAPSSLEVDERSWWQMIVFINDVGVVYLIWLLESSRPSSRGTAARFPAIIGTIAQLAGGGVFFPVQNLLHYVFCPPVSIQKPSDRRVNVGDALKWSPLVVVLHTVPAIGMYIAPNFNTRHWFCWFWQLYTVRISLGYYILRTLGAVLNISSPRGQGTYHQILRLAMSPLIAVSATIWIYVVFQSPFSLATIFWPSKVEGEFAGTFVGFMRRMLQFDQWFLMGSHFLWTWYLLRDMKIAGLVSFQKALSIALGVLLVPVLGPGATAGLLWLWRESYLVQDGEHIKLK
ncbi:hypothetical protein BU24DRAFT_448457 [Aaosphaeria arxii CBS 175.79]|uniref:Uncharacterized protein n=1 Tax=Aaosphaeria arxii CBS 175.79 TaxID=1450172 RepID=A0A6A5Y4A4_9PLEO|nr:uncharacterized protein BU24DRAFT_448457 [Aaosphaeria arxii CBS 175.79]KAF2020109.1 hypothetical protein BU24DRAFT_448457 [Aaosphaeria arxii CBS 175.79]